MSLRFDNAREWVLCGVIDCGARIGVRGERRLALLPGYRRDGDGVVRMPPKRVKRMQSGRYAGAVPPGLRKVRGGGAGKGWGSGLSPVLPARVKCWQCEFVSNADAQTLEVVSPKRDVSVVLNEAFSVQL